MENIRIIKDKIKSCMSCNEDQCPIIKERLERHVLSHHSSSTTSATTATTTRPTVSSQNMKPKRLSDTPSLKSALTMTTSDVKTSTSDLITERLNKISSSTIYRKRLVSIINEWAKQLPKYPSASAENLKQNIVNELIEKLDNISREANKGYYDLKLAIEIDKFIDSLPSFSDISVNESETGNLKEILIEKINELNKYISNGSKNPENDNKLKIKDNTANTQQSYKNNLTYRDKETKTPYNSLSDDSESATELNLREKRNGKILVDAEVQQSFPSIKPFYGNMYENPIYKNGKQKKNIDVMENVYKEIISIWLDKLTRNLIKKEKKIISDAVLNRLKPLLYKKYTIDHKLLLKAEILNCLNDYTNILISPENYSTINRISDDLVTKLLGAKLNNEEVYLMTSMSKSYFQNSEHKMPMNFEPDNYLDPIVQNIVIEELESLDISNLIEQDIINIIMQNIKLICIRQDHYTEELIFDILQHYTELSDYSISNIIKSILDQIRIVASSSYLQIYNSAPFIDSFKLFRPSLISVYKSEHEMRGPNNVPFGKKSSDSNYPPLTAEERIYVNNVSQLIKAWMTILPTSGSKTGSKKTKEGIIDNLVQDILDQVKLEQIIPETKVEKEKYLAFFIHRWLNRLNCFEKAADAQPYIKKLIEKIISIPVPCIPNNYDNSQSFNDDREITPSLMSCNQRECVISRDITNNAQLNDKNQNKANTLKTDAILREFIIKYIEHNCDEDNPITREVFGHILKNELQKLSTPTRKSVYGNLTNQIDNVLASETLATELSYINIISDWFKTLPLESSFNVIGNKLRAQYVNDLAKIISNLEENRLKIPEIDYNRHLKSTVSQFTDKLPITNHDISFLIDDFITKIASLRPPTPCCAFVNKTNLSLNASNKPHQNLSDFIEAYIRENSYEIAEDELKLDAWSLRIFEEIDNMASENPPALSTAQVYNRLANISAQGVDIGQRFNLKLSYAKEISNWLNNLPLLPIVDKTAKDLRIQMISNLADKMSARWQIKNIDPNNTQADVDLADYIPIWITELPLDRNKEIVLPLVVEQILNRMERVNKGKQKMPLMQQEPQKNKNNNCKFPHPCCNKKVAQKLTMLDPGRAIVEGIETWCNNLPIETENSNTLKEEFSTKLYKKVGELNKNPEYFDNNILYLQMLEDEIDLGLDKLPQNPQLQNTRQKLKQELLDIVNENKILMREKAAGMEYRQELAKTIEMSLPNTISLSHFQNKINPGFDIYKNRLAELFILENFDHTQNDVKLNYVKRLQYEIDKSFQEVQKMHLLPLTKEQMFNELYSTLFSVPPPNETCIAEEVEEIKTRCEIQSWFESLPIREATGLVELFEWDQILSMLAKRLHYMEKCENKPNDNMNKEITKWLLKLPLNTGQEKNVNKLANDLQQRLKLTLNDRKCKFRDSNKSQKESLINKNKNKGILGVSQVAGPSRDGMPWLSPPSSPVRENLQKTPKRPSDLILDIVETWCQQLPLPENTQQEKDNAKLLKDNLVVKIIMKISELNGNSETFEDDFLYDVILDDELENLISTLPISCKLIQSKNILKKQLKDAIKSIKPLIMEEKARYEYKQELKNTVEKVLELPPNAPPEKVALFTTLRDEIVDNFVAYSFCKNNEEGQEIHKAIVQNAVEEYFVGKIITISDEVPDPLMKGNQLLCELAKVPVPSANVILDEIHEIWMKFQISDLFTELSLTEHESKLNLKNQVKSALAKRLSNYNKTSLIKNHSKVKDDIIKCLQKIQHEIDPEKVEMFIKRLETSENGRNLEISPDNNINCISPNQITKNNSQTSYKGVEKFRNNENVEDKQWMSLLPATPRMHDPNYHDTLELREYRKSLGEVGSPQCAGHAFDRSITQSGISYDKFKEGKALSSSVKSKYQPIHSLSNSNDKARAEVSCQSQCCSVDPSNSVDLNKDYQPIDNKANQALGSSLKNHENSDQPLSLGPHNIHKQPQFTQQMGMTPDLQKTCPPQSGQTCPYSQQNNPSQIGKRSFISIQTPSQSQNSQQLRYIPSDNKNLMSASAPKYQANTCPTSSQIPIQNPDVQSERNQYRTPSSCQETSAPQNIPESCSSPSYSIPPMPPFSCQIPYPKVNKSCRRPSIALLNPPEMPSNNNQDNIVPISDDDEIECVCMKKRRKQSKSSLICPAHKRTHCRLCNGVNNAFYRRPLPYRHCYHC